MGRVGKVGMGCVYLVGVWQSRVVPISGGLTLW